ncbi:heavy metal translocating P-type ATPase [Streptomyces sp. OF3]|uniref:Heavy metal translocating P-type ATPase n=1 Tax=Streptomyces alkaliterrae TaxID=2213162 RepID=A0A7W3ZQG2_9ACTN|nr:heavy metal translocating P-type ATPase [Streptomyces alkaliterrae]MBB1256631.1 heavy metal translocating P-type ATPase [Streptomyces alkaliterrae]
MPSALSSTLSAPARPAVPRPGPAPRRTRLFALPEVRWAAAAALAFLVALPLQLLGAPVWWWAPLYAVVYLAGGWEPAWSGLCALRERTLDVDLLMVVAAIGALAVGEVMDGALLIVIFATSGALEALATARTEDSVRGLLDLAPGTATRLTGDGGEEVVRTDELAVGEVILVRPGERVGADGRVVAGASDVDQATITGEPLPAAKAVGDDVFAGTLNGNGTLRVRVERDPADFVVARIVAMVAEASETKAPTQLFVERVEQRYSVGMVIATLAVFGVPVALGAEFSDALLRAMTFMIVASPCAVVLATMPPLLSAIANAGRHGVLVKSAVVMERLGQIDTVALDKTGTLTEGSPRLTDLRPVPGTDLDEAALLALAAAAERPSEHPVGRAIVAAAAERGLDLPEAADFLARPGVGVRATVEGREVTVGAPPRLPGEAGRGAEHGESVRRLVAEVEARGRTAVLVAVGGTAVGVLGVADRARIDAARAVRGLTALTGAPPTLLTGDNPRSAAVLADEVGIGDVRAGLLPQDKVAAVHEWEQAGKRVLLVGDGVNDAPALAAADTGVAMGRVGSDLALETADAVVVRDELAAVPTVVALSRAARRLVVQNLVIAGTFIVVLVAWDLLWHLPLPLGVLGHEGSTVLVGLNGLRLLREAAWRRAAAEPETEHGVPHGERGAAGRAVGE